MVVNTAVPIVCHLSGAAGSLQIVICRVFREFGELPANKLDNQINQNICFNSIYLPAAAQPHQQHSMPSLRSSCLTAVLVVTVTTCCCAALANAAAYTCDEHELCSSSVPVPAACTASIRQRIGWGVSTAAYQIEGGWNEGGRAPSVWDVWSQEPGRVYESQNGNVRLVWLPSSLPCSCPTVTQEAEHVRQTD